MQILLKVMIVLSLDLFIDAFKISIICTSIKISKAVATVHSFIQGFPRAFARGFHFGALLLYLLFNKQMYPHVFMHE